MPTNYSHIDVCHYYGRTHLDFARFLLKDGIQFKIPTWTNTVPVSLLCDEVCDDAPPEVLADARELANLYIKLGANSVWTCAPYQLSGLPKFGEKIIASESNAISYFNADQQIRRFS